MLFPHAPGFAANSVSVPPAATAVATPLEFTVATLGADELQFTVLLVLPSERVTVAVNVLVRPVGTAALAGDTTTLTGTAAVTTKLIGAEVVAPNCAVTGNVPVAVP